MGSSCSRGVIRLNYQISDADLDHLLSATEWNRPMIEYLWGGKEALLKIAAISAELAPKMKMLKKPSAPHSPPN